MNKEAFKQVLKIVEKSAKAKTRDNRVFEFMRWFSDETSEHETIGDIVKHPCGTVGCIGGWGAVLEIAKTPEGLKERKEVLYGDAGSRAAESFFGISHSHAEWLFMGHFHRHGLRATDADVIAKLKNIIQTGKVKNPEFDARYQ